MSSLESYPVQFPGLHLSFPVHRVLFSIGPLTVTWYGVLIACGLLLAMLYCFRRSKEFEVTADDLTDVVLWSVIFGIIGARLYYVIFSNGTGDNSYFANPLSIFEIWNGGLAIWGGIIGAVAAACVTCHIKKKSVVPFLDLAAFGFPIGQAFGRWGNFFNREAHGGQTNVLWRMTGVDDTNPTQGYHPCFLYESLWCALGFVLLHFYSKHRKFKGELFLMYVAWYSFGRFFIESLRSDSLCAGSVKVSMLVSAVCFVAAVATLLVVYSRLRRSKPEDKSYLEGYQPVYADALQQMREEKGEGAEGANAGESGKTEKAPEETGEAGEPAPAKTPENGSGENGGESKEDTENEKKDAEDGHDGENH